MWLDVLRLVLQLTTTYVGWMRERDLLDAGAAQLLAEHQKATDEILKQTEAARRVVRDRARDFPDSVRDEDDGHRRD
jgi:hypothetical protein